MYMHWKKIGIKHWESTEGRFYIWPFVDGEYKLIDNLTGWQRICKTPRECKLIAFYRAKAVKIGYPAWPVWTCDVVKRVYGYKKT